MQQPPELPPSAKVKIKITHRPAPIWVRLLAGIADATVAFMVSMLIVVFIMIPSFFPEMWDVIYDYRDQATSSFSENNDLTRTFLEDPAVQNMVLAAAIINFLTIFFYYAINEWILKGSSFGKKIFSIRAVRRIPGEPLSTNVIILRAWLKTLFLIFFPPYLWITFIWAVFQKDKRAVHDLITGTWVID